MQIFLLEKKVYEATKEIILGKVEKHPFLIEFSDWLMRKYSIKILNAQLFSDFPDRFYIIIENTKDFEKMLINPSNFSQRKQNPKYEAEIISKIKELGRKHNFASEFRLRDIYIKYHDFLPEVQTDVNFRAIKEARASITKKYPMVWYVEVDFYGTIIFYYLDKDILVNKENGLSKVIEEEYFLILKKYDDISFITKENLILEFDSKENLDKNFGNSSRL